MVYTNDYENKVEIKKVLDYLLSYLTFLAVESAMLALPLVQFDYLTISIQEFDEYLGQLVVGHRR